MIQSFRRGSGLRRLWLRGDPRRLPPHLVPRIEEILSALEAAFAPRDMDFPGYRLHPLKGALRGRWAVRVSGPWRIHFRFAQGGVADVCFENYH